MQDIIATILAEQMAEIIVATVLGAMAAVGTFTLAQLNRFLGEKRTALLSEKLGAAIDRAKADAAVKGLTGETAKVYIADYLKQTMSGTLKKLKASDEDLGRRIAAQIAQGVKLDPASLVWPS
ncbi:hypothetical protein [Paracoccus yeei]|uniref:hypothetical protein n=1 Tax=Paracoccus yeei TaxID=147645 RepID=UPI00174BAFAA|nr:hypothetical protein [Paracoccus yeei]